MASIDKIYGTQAQYWELWTFCYEHRPSLLAYFRPSHVTDKRPNEERTICSLPVRADMWLWANCPIEWVRARLIEQYGEAGPPEWCSTKPIRKRYGRKHAFQPPARPKRRERRRAGEAASLTPTPSAVFTDHSVVQNRTTTAVDWGDTLAFLRHSIG
jgi:hypothetical protein